MLDAGGACMAMSAPLVDAPLRPPKSGAGGFRPVLVALERCKGCGLCVDVCAPHVLELDASLVNAMGHHPVRLLDAVGCTSCAKCARVCPDAALTILARPKGA
jgi:2-oxoglutarate ferredoxin oxidoreductase subunit delta